MNTNMEYPNINKFDFSSFVFEDRVKYHLSIMMNALFNVSKDYLWYQDYINQESDKIMEHLERVFAYEFYHQWRTLLDSLKCPLMLNGEIAKAIKDAMRNNGRTTLFPDLVLHGGQSDSNSANQLIACEIKRACAITSTKFRDDIESLTYYVGKKFFYACPFQCGVFLLVGGSLSKLTENYINEIAKLGLDDQLQNRIICVSFDYDKDGKGVIDYKTLKTLICNY